MIILGLSNINNGKSKINISNPWIIFGKNISQKFTPKLFRLMHLLSENSEIDLWLLLPSFYWLKVRNNALRILEFFQELLKFIPALNVRLVLDSFWHPDENPLWPSDLFTHKISNVPFYLINEDKFFTVCPFLYWFPFYFLRFNLSCFLFIYFHHHFCS